MLWAQMERPWLMIMDGVATRPTSSRSCRSCENGSNISSSIAEFGQKRYRTTGDHLQGPDAAGLRRIYAAIPNLEANLCPAT